MKNQVTDKKDAESASATAICYACFGVKFMTNVNNTKNWVRGDACDVYSFPLWGDYNFERETPDGIEFSDMDGHIHLLPATHGAIINYDRQERLIETEKA